MRSYNFLAKGWGIVTRYCICLAFLLLGWQNVHAQDLLKGTDLSTVKIDNLSDADIAKFQSQLQESGLTFPQAQQAALAKGMPQAELDKLRDRLAKLPATGTGAPSAQSKTAPKTIIREVQKDDYKTFQKESSSPDIFGSLLFTTPSLSFEPNLRIAVPVGYAVGPDDEFVITVSGYQEANLVVQIQPEGNISIPQVGPISVVGLTFEEASKRIKDRMAKTAYPNISSGLTQVNITLGKIRSVHVTVLGAAKPGNYTVSSLTSLFNSLYQSGGPGSINSYRRIELLRSNKVVKTIDLYQFLLKGDQSGNLLLKEGDVINIPVYGKRVTISGEVKRPGIYEMLENESLETLLFFAGGFTEKAYRASLKIKQFTETERRIKDLPAASFAAYIPGNGDEVTVEPIVERLENSVSIKGAVFRPGQFELTPGLTVSGLIKKAQGVKEDAFMDRATITRTHDDQTKENISFQPRDLLNGGSADILLMKRDEVTIASSTAFISSYTIRVQGEVRKPDEYPYKENLTLKDVLFTAGGFTDAASAYRVEIGRRVNSDIVSAAIDTIAEVFDINTDKDLSLNGDKFHIKPFDIITVRKKPGYIEQKTVTIKGQVLYPGIYTIQSKKERISDLFNRAGGVTSLAFAPGASLTRSYVYNTQLKDAKIAKAELIKESLKDTSNAAIDDITNESTKIVVDLNQVFQHPGSKEDYVLEEGDIIEVPKLDPLVKISGEVFQPVKTSFESNASMRYYLARAGGTTDNARLSKTYVLYPNGEIAKTRNGFFGMFRSFPRITTGAEIVVPKKLPRKKLTAAETIGISTAFLSLVSLLIVTISTLKR